MSWQERFSRAIAAHRAGNAALARDLCREAAAVADDAGPMRMLAVLLAEDGAAEEARAWAERALAMAPAAASSLATLGQVALRAQDFDRARLWFERALAADPSLGAARAGLAQSARRMGQARFAVRDFAGATTAFQQAVAAAPAEATTWHDLGVALHEAGRLEDAAAAYRQALARDAMRVETWHNLGSLRQARRDVDGAMLAYAAAFRLDPGSLPRIAQELAAGAAGRVYLRVERLIEDLQTAGEARLPSLDQ